MSALRGWLFGRHGGMQHRMLAWPVAAALVIAIHLVSMLFIQRLEINNAPEVYYASGAPAVLLRNELRRDFPSDEVLTVVFQGKELYGHDFLGRLDRLGATLQRNPLVDRVTSVTSLERISGSGDGFSVGRLLDLGRLQGSRPEDLRERVMGDRFAPGLLASRDGSTLALAVRPKPLTTSAERLALKIAVLIAINDAGLRPFFAGDAGPVSIDVAQLESVLDDSRLFVPLTAAIGLLLLGWVVGRLRPVLIGAVAMSTVVMPVLAAIGISGQPYTMASAILPSLLAAYTLATLLHLYAAVQRAQAAQPSRALRVDKAMADTLRPSTFNVLTTGAGMLSLVLVPIPPIQVFGVAGALGTLLVFLTVFYLVPPLLVRWDGKSWPQRGSGMTKLGRIAARLTLTSMRHPKSMVLVAACLLVGAFPLAQQIQVESDVLAFFKPEHPISRHTKLIESKLAGVTSLEISLVGESRDSLQNVARLGAMRDFQRWLETLPEVDRSVSMVDLVEEMHWAMNDEEPTFRALPGSDRLLRQYFLVYDGQDLYELVNRDFQHARILLNLNVHGAKEIGRTIDTIRQRLEANPLPGLKVDIGGYGRLFSDQMELLVTGQVNSFSGTFVQIFLFMAILWRSLGASAVCMVPNLAPLYLIFVLMGATGIHLDLATVMIAGVVLGITVDDTIHLYHGYLHRRKKGISPVLAIARSFESSGRAVLAISVVLVAQFALMTASDFKPTANFGLMVAVGLLSGQVAELLLLPALLVLKDGPRRATAARTRRSFRSWPRNADAWAPTELLRHKETEPGGSPGLDDAWAPTQMLMRSDHAPGVGSILVCQGQACAASGAEAVWKRLKKDRAATESGSPGSAALIVKTSCLGRCDWAPVMQIVPAGRFCRGHDQHEQTPKIEAQPLGTERLEQTA